jgi:hypothetical protein
VAQEQALEPGVASSGSGLGGGCRIGSHNASRFRLPPRFRPGVDTAVTSMTVAGG